MKDASLRRASSDLPGGVTPLHLMDSDLSVASVDWAVVEESLVRSPEALAQRILDEEFGAVTMDIGSLNFPTVDQASAVSAFVDALQFRGTSVVLHGATPGFLTAACVDGDDVRFSVERDLETALAVLDEYDEMRTRCTSDRGRRINQLRLPARSPSVPLLCAFIRDRLELGGVPRTVLLGLLQDAYAAMTESLARCIGDGHDLAASATVHDGRATITLLDSGPEVAGEREGPPERVDRTHRFRILDRHNALVLEKDLSGTPVAGEAPDSVS